MSRLTPTKQFNGRTNGSTTLKPPVLIGTTKFTPNPLIKNVMITGGAGFIASWVTRHLTMTYPNNYNIVVFDKLDYCASLKNLKPLEDCTNYSFFYGDITDQQAVLRCMRIHQIDTVLHFAAMSHVDLSFGNSLEFTRVNVMGTHIMLEAAVKMNVKKFVHVSTDEVNGETQHGDPDLLEDSILAPTNPYAASKAGAEMLVNSFNKSYKLGCIIVRSNNVYGPNQFPEKIIPKFSCLLDRSRALFLHGSGRNTRRYLYASDAADAFDTILHKGVNGQIYNVDSVDEVSNIELAMKMLDVFDLAPENSTTDHLTGDSANAEWKNEWIRYTRDRPFNDMRYAVDASKLKRLGWTQKVRFDQGLPLTVDWYRKFGAKWWEDEVESVLTAFPEVKGGDFVIEDPGQKQRAFTDPKLEGSNGFIDSNGPDYDDGNGMGETKIDLPPTDAGKIASNTSTSMTRVEIAHSHSHGHNGDSSRKRSADVDIEITTNATSTRVNSAVLSPKHNPAAMGHGRSISESFSTDKTMLSSNNAGLKTLSKKRARDDLGSQHGKVNVEEKENIGIGYVSARPSGHERGLNAEGDARGHVEGAINGDLDVNMDLEMDMDAAGDINAESAANRNKTSLSA